jgi:hypothetical protein
MDKEPTICPKCGKPAWAPYLMAVTKKYGQVYRYEVYRHPDGRRRTPRKCTVRVPEATKEQVKGLMEAPTASA